MQKSALVVCMVSACLLLSGCGIQTLPMHNPIYPTSSDNVTYSLEANAPEGIATIRLYEQLSTSEAGGTWLAGAENLIHTWSVSGSPTSQTVSYARTSTLPANTMVRYRFEVVDTRSNTRSHDVTFAVNPYPVADEPAPVYVQHDPDGVFDVVFIPDNDITNLATFYGHCRGMIRDAMFAEPTVRVWSRQFNFYINPDRGTATDYDRIASDGYHQTPANWDHLSFAECKCLMHQGDLRDYASGGLFSTEQQNRGTLLHEGGHAMFGLADEYPGGAHWQSAVLPNNWSTLTGAQTDAPHRHKTAADARQIGTDGWYKICLDDCHACVSGLNVTATGYDAPCDDRVTYTVIENAVGH